MKTSKVLRKAKEPLATDYKMGVCRAVDMTRSSRQDLLRICLFISKRLDGWAYASEWLGHQILFPKVDFDDLTNEQYSQIYSWSRCVSAKEIQAWRHAWLDHMIAEFEAKGD